MGHNIIAYDTKAKKDVAELEFGAFNHVMSHMIYDALDAQKYNGGASGIGREVKYTPKKTKLALEKFKYKMGEHKEDILEEIESSRGTEASKMQMTAILDFLKIKAPIKREIPDDAIEEYQGKVLEFLEAIQGREKLVIYFG